MNIKKYILTAKSWKDLNKTLENLTKSNRAKLAGDIFEYLTKLYLETAPQYKSKLKRVYLEKEVPNNLRKKLNLPDTDEGIDLISETNDKEYWAIQCKYRSNPSDTLTLENLSTFRYTAFTHCNKISHGIVCATVNKTPKKKKLLKRVGYELLETWLGLDDGDLFDQIKAKCVGKKYKPVILKPRPHQIEAIKKTKEHFKSNERGKIVMPCGTGKSLTAFWIAKEMGVKSILVAVPSLALLQQTLKVWTREFLINDIEPEWFCVCSDGTVKDEQDDYVTDTSDLGIKVETDPKQIKQFLKKKTSKIKVVFTTYQSGRATAKGSKGFTYDLGIMDEAHKTVGSKTKEMAHLLHQKNIRIKKRIFMTATERLFRGDSDEFMSMDDPRDYGSLIYELSFKQAINSKPPIISDYKIITFGITVPEIEEIYNSNKYLEVKKVLKDITARELATALALRKAIKKFKINNAISFHRSIRRADNFRTQQELITKIYPEYGKLKSFHVRGDMPTADRAVQMREFAKGKGLMTNARCLTEGVDLPAIDCVCFTDPKRSKVDIVQAAGRALRLSKGKKFGYILIPIFIPAGADFNEAAEEQGFDDVAITVRSLATTDQRIVEYLRAISEGKKPRGGSPVEGITSANSLYKIEAEEFDKAIKLKVWDKVAKGNWLPFEEAKKIVRKLGVISSTDFKKRKLEFPKNMPSLPSSVYINSWISWGNFLGTNSIAPSFREYVSFKEAKKYALSLKLNGMKAWSKKVQKKNFPLNIPKRPYEIYKKEWRGFGDFLGTGNIAAKNLTFLPYKEAKQIVKKLKIRSSSEYIKLWRKEKLKNLPAGAPNVYKNQGWKGWSDFLGIRNNRGNFVNFLSVKKFAKEKDIKTKSEWYAFIRSNVIPDNIPKDPVKLFKKSNEWKGWKNFLETNYYSYEAAKRIAIKLKTSGSREYKKVVRKMNNPQLPLAPQTVYKNNGWTGWQNYLGHYTYSFDEAKRIVSKYKFNSLYDFQKRFNFNNYPYMPKHPPSVYGLRLKQWKGWPDFLGRKK